MTLRGWSGDEVRFPRILGIECVGAVAEPSPPAPRSRPARPWPPSWAAWGAAFDGGYAEYALLPESQLMRARDEPRRGTSSARCRRRSSRPPGSLETLGLARGRDAARARRHLVGRARVPRARARRGPARLRDDAERGEDAGAARSGAPTAIVDGGRRLRRARPRRSCREAPRRRRRPDRRARGARLARSRAARRHRLQLGPARRRVGDRRLRAHRAHARRGAS